MNPQTFIFTGRSGCGKGTQGKLLREHLQKMNRDVFYLESGEQFRTLIAGSSYTSNLSREAMVRGDLQPEFLAVWAWSHIFVEQLKDGQDWILDGTPRKLHEARVLHSAFEFYKRPKPIVIFMNVSRQWSIDRMHGRGRADDMRDSDIEKRLGWYESEVVPIIENYRKDPFYTFIQVYGERPVEEIAQDIIEKLRAVGVTL